MGEIFKSSNESMLSKEVSELISNFWDGLIDSAEAQVLKNNLLEIKETFGGLLSNEDFKRIDDTMDAIEATFVE